VVAIVGPPKVGKSTLLQALIKNFTRQNITSIQGPVTIVIGNYLCILITIWETAISPKTGIYLSCIISYEGVDLEFRI